MQYSKSWIWKLYILIGTSTFSTSNKYLERLHLFKTKILAKLLDEIYLNETELFHVK